MTSSNGYERPPYHDESFQPSASPRAVSPLQSTSGQENAYDASRYDVSAEALLNPAPAKEQTNAKHSEQQLSHSRELHIRDWYWEFIAAVFSIACVIAVIIILRKYQGKSLSSWHFYHDITLNTLVALLSTLSRTALIVPVASCISQLKWIHLVSSPRPLHEYQILDEASRGPWGSLTLIFTLHFKTKLATWGALITIVSLTMGPLSQQLLSYPSREHPERSGATFYRNQIYDTGAGYGLTQASTRTMDPKMQGAILNGLYNLSAPIQVQCQTGNCRWEDFTTLAVTSECKNVTSSSNMSCEFSRGTSSCNYTTPSDFFISSYSSTSSGDTRSTGFNSTALPPQTTSHLGELLNSTLLKFAAAKISTPFTDENPDITECSMRWVARLVQNTTFSNGTFHPGIAKDYELIGVVNPFDSNHWVTFNVSDESGTFPGNKSFSVLPTDNTKLMEFLNMVFSSSKKDLFGLVLNNVTDFTQTMKSMSDSITYALGQSPTGQELAGEAITFEQYVYVNWGWIILPIIEVAMGIAFLVATLLQNWRKGVVAWKGSAIIPLVTEMEGWHSGECRAGSAREADKMAKGMTGLLESKEDGGQIFRRV
ncbi:hypothetical protein COCC4DRAFT_46673 [Bipolaris maydis ATCC 48331]|uniref:Uncharacterized protein n=2 Tax=Cochliobolus heterostrophus TaxID=5016 RepID=M2URK5_COCH5|nr:uncharacterized protein COCC4DRAFT_46673 [Bipolaris maydis ATCC 48331]EMD96231.1 hypothetical protein COCHEDRAFT_1221831 [Bipolaris maydis C5]KAJ5030895.1 hypothetical protein J3E73DRAFT_226188 [Bipolaris maydis]ENI11090.1 hypothetical protein COCC4DRAFT_46673 [Bipolaris maydis ATCC 48331]KAJ5065922.1 hypothetical protein J3E74DRAFT_414838 [Bipolaris maydis]KAJ6201118.1 hypothetical protein J3E72DRAFT_383578 [Bipolaris maydis]